MALLLPLTLLSSPSTPANGFGTNVPAEFGRVGGDPRAVDCSDKTEYKKVDLSLQSTALPSPFTPTYSAGTKGVEAIGGVNGAEGASGEDKGRK